MQTKMKTAETEKTTAFTALINLLVQQFTPLQIYSFAKLRQEEEINSTFCTNQLQVQCVYYLLMITDGFNTKERKAQDFIDGTYTDAKVVILVHDKETLFSMQHNCNGFFAAVLNQGKLCYSMPGFECVAGLKRPNPKRQLGRTIVHWRKRIEMANGFFVAAGRAIDTGHEEICLFLLHHAAEQACLGLIYVFMDYQSNSHNLKQLLYLCACFSKRPLQHFFGIPENELLLKIMMECFNRTVFQNDPYWEDKSVFCFSDLVEGFLKLARCLCDEHFKALQLALDLAK